MQPTRPAPGPAPSAALPLATRPAKTRGVPGLEACRPGPGRAGDRFAALLGADLRRTAPAAPSAAPAGPRLPSGRSATHHHGVDEREPQTAARRGAARDRSREGDPLAPFQPLPPALQPPLASSAPATSVGSAAARAEAAALAERLVTSLRVGRVGKDGHELRMKLALAHGSGVEVRLRAEHGALHATLVSEPGARASAVRLAEGLAAELRERGITCESIEVA